MTTEGLDQACRTCGRRSGSHTLDEWAACGPAESQHLPYAAVPDGIIPLTISGEAVAWADHMTARSAIIGGDERGIKTRFPAVIFGFQMGMSEGPLHEVSTTALVGTPEMMRKVGRILRDTCNGAANTVDPRR